MLKATKKPAADKPKKPRSDFPLFPHASGRWAKKVRGQFAYFGNVANDPKGETALTLWLDRKDDLLAGRTPRAARDGLTVKTLFDRFMGVKEAQVDTREITRRHFDDLYSVCKIAVAHFGKNRYVTDLVAEDFESLRKSLAKTRGAWALGGAIQKIRSVFKYAYEAGLIDAPVRYGPTFKRPGKAAIRRERADKGPRMFEPAELHTIIETAGQQLKAMILLALNCGMGNSDCGQLKFHNVDLKGGWLNYPRPKTGVDRRCPLWKETIKAIKAAIDDRPEPNDDAAARDFVFITKYGQPWAKDKMANPIQRRSFGNCSASYRCTKRG